MSQLIEVRPLKPFVGTYKCSLAEADMIDDAWIENDQGQLVKSKVPKKRFIGLIPVQRAMRPAERDLFDRQQPLPDNIEVLDEQGMMVIEHPKERTIKVPPEVASSLVSRQLAEIVKADKSTNRVGKPVSAANAA